MARAGPVHGIKPREGLRENAQRIVAVRLDEMLSWRYALNDPTLIQDLHNMRIAAKRLRYALEMFDVCFPQVKPVLKELSNIQEDLGTIHDFDVLIELLRERLKTIDGSLEGRAVEIMQTEADAKEKSLRLRQVLSAQARDQRRLGLIGLIGDKVVERERRFGAFQQQWGGAALEEFGLRVRQAVELVTPESPEIESVAAHSAS
jgi:hypothetical protein